MGATMWGKRSLASTLAARSLAVLWLHGGHSLVLASEPAFDAQAIRVDMTIKAGQFHPSPVSMPVGGQSRWSFIPRMSNCMSLCRSVS